MGAQFYNRDEKEGLTEIGAEMELLAKKTRIIWSDIPHWSKELMDRHAKKVEENLAFPQQGKEEDDEVLVRTTGAKEMDSTWYPKYWKDT